MIDNDQPTAKRGRPLGSKDTTKRSSPTRERQATMPKLPRKLVRISINATTFELLKVTSKSFGMTAAGYTVEALCNQLVADLMEND